MTAQEGQTEPVGASAVVCQQQSHPARGVSERPAWPHPTEASERRFVQLHVSLVGGRNLAEQIHQQVRTAIVNGWLRVGDVLPPTRHLSEHLAVSRNTVATAYERLAAEGLTRSRQGVGTYVTAAAAVGGKVSRRGSPLQPRPVWDRMPDPVDASISDVTYDFRPGVPDASHFPYASWRALIAGELRHGVSDSAVDPAGHPMLRSAIARHLRLARGVPANAADVVVTNGRQHAIDLVARVLLRPGDTVAVEDPGDIDVHAAFLAHGARTVSVPVDGEGIRVDAIPDGVRLVYVTPSHQMPLGMTMSPARRRALLEWAERADAAVLEDDSDSDLHYGGRPVDAIRTVDTTGRVLYIGSFSRVLLATLRLGFVIAPPELYPALRKARHAVDRHAEISTQAAMARFIDTGMFAKHLRRLRAVYIERRQKIRNILVEELAAHVDLLPSAGGLQFAMTLRRDVDDVEIAHRARSLTVALHPLSSYTRTPGPPGLVIGYGAIRTHHIVEGMRLLLKCLDG